MTQTSSSAASEQASANPLTTRYHVLSAISLAHFLNDTIQSLLLAIYPLLKSNFSLDFLQIGLITLTYQLTASMLQPLVGSYTDKHPKPFSLAIGMGSTLSGLLLLSIAPNFTMVLLAAALIGTGSSIFHPESSRIARLAAGGRPGLAQSIFQVGGNSGSALGPLLAAGVVMPGGQRAVAWFALLALLAIVVLVGVGRWYRRKLQDLAVYRSKNKSSAKHVQTLPRHVVTRTIGILLLLIFSKYFYLASLTSYYTFFLMTRFHLSAQEAQIYLFVFLFAVAAGTLLGGPLGDRIGRRQVIWFSILGVAPFTLALPYVDLMWTGILSFVIGLILASAFPAILVFAQDLMPGRLGAVSGMFFGFSFGMGGIAAAVLGVLADWRSIEFVYHVCAYLPLLGLFAIFLPDVRRQDDNLMSNT